ncbi:DUF1349 domain-containing protein [Paenibacillus sp. L3-i20]|uniref:DUF1349 domain-containing protein n=1 Tax=Paenibacillus sp. L3-i20 TaxID=2905833 RepID=UPI001EE08CB9|nr:DUF1349 domain-containing protein [Paenibacillus sp. L3-i20]GKU78038.1 hypothetical protein L3i20_v224350 [Paenibacillus sp. L3-i20]
MNLKKQAAIVMTTVCCTLFITGCSTNSNKTSAQLDELVKLSDEFDQSNTLDQWLTAKDISNIKNIERFVETLNINETKPGSLFIDPVAGTWYNSFNGHLSYKKVKGDFSVTMRVKVLGNATSIPSGAFDLAGLMARMPSQIEGEVVKAGDENWEYFTTGGNGNKRIIDFKQTINGRSGYIVKEVNTEWIILRMVRVGTKFVKMYKEDEQGEWQFASSSERTDLPDELQVGISILTNLYGEPDFTVEADYIRFSTPTLSKEIQDKVVQNTITDEEWLAALSNL